MFAVSRGFKNIGEIIYENFFGRCTILLDAFARAFAYALAIVDRIAIQRAWFRICARSMGRMCSVSGRSRIVDENARHGVENHRAMGG